MHSCLRARMRVRWLRCGTWYSLSQPPLEGFHCPPSALILAVLLNRTQMALHTTASDRRRRQYRGGPLDDAHVGHMFIPDRGSFKYDTLVIWMLPQACSRDNKIKHRSMDSLLSTTLLCHYNVAGFFCLAALCTWFFTLTWPTFLPYCLLLFAAIRHLYHVPAFARCLRANVWVVSLRVVLESKQQIIDSLSYRFS